MPTEHFVPDLEDLEARIAPSGPTVTATGTPADVNKFDTVSMSPLPTDGPTLGVSPGLGGTPGGSGDRGAPGGVVGD